MDSAIEAVLDEYHKRAKAKFERIDKMPFEVELSRYTRGVEFT